MSARPGTAHVADTAQGPAGSLLDSGEINLLNRLGYELTPESWTV